MYNLDFIDTPTLKKTKESILINRQSEKKLGITVVEKGIILPFKSQDISNNQLRIYGGGVITQSFEHISVVDIGDEVYSYSKSDVKDEMVEVVYLGIFHPKWGHCITDNIKKIWYLFTTEFQILLASRNIEIVYTVFGDFKLEGSFKDLLTCLGVIPEKLKPVRDITRYQKVYIPDDSFIFENNERFYTKEFQEIICRIPTFNTSKIYDKVYFTRSKFDSNDFGEKEIENFFKKIGYKIIVPEILSFKEQVSILQNCHTFAATEGSISHNNIFCKDNSNSIIIRKSDSISNYQLSINQLKKINVTYIDTHLSLFNSVRQWEGPFFLYVNENLQRFANSKSFLNSFSISKFMKYVESSFQLGFYKKEELDVYYWDKLKFEFLNSKRHKYRKLANKLFPTIFPYKGGW